MQIKKYTSADYERVARFLTDCYGENHAMTCWLPERFDDLIYRIDTLHAKERSGKASQDYIRIFEENDEIIGLILPDGDSFNSCIKRGCESIFERMLDVGERELLPLFCSTDGKIDFLVISHDSLRYQSEALRKRGYVREEATDYDNVQFPMNTNYNISLPAGFRLSFGSELDGNRKAKACHYGFHPEDDDGVLTGAFREGALSYQARKSSRFYPDSFECLIVTDDGDICSYCFCYVNKETSTALIEPVCTRKKYRRKGLCKQMLYGVINKLKALGIDCAYINSYDWRRQVYNSAGFQTIDSIGFWHKTITL